MKSGKKVIVQMEHFTIKICVLLVWIIVNNAVIMLILDSQNARSVIKATICY